MAAPRLWNVQDATPDTFANAGAFAAALRQHLQYTPAGLISVLLQIGAEQSAYVLAAGCAGCALDSCVPGCRVDLLERVIGVGYAESHLRLVTRGLLPRPYTRVVLAWPTTTARPLEAGLLHPWREARLTLHWRHRRRPRAVLTLGAVLAVGQDGPDPVPYLRTLRWRALPVRLAAALYMGQPRGTFWQASWRQAPHLLLPSRGVGQAGARPIDAASAGAGMPELRPCVPMGGAGCTAEPLPVSAASAQHTAVGSPNAARLAALLGGEPAWTAGGSTPTREEAPPVASGSGAAPVAGPARMASAADAPDPCWPALPGRMAPAELRQLVERLVTSPPINAGPFPGLTPGRLHTVLLPGQRPLTRLLLVWFDRAGLLEASVKADEPYRHPRPLRCADPGWIAAQLLNTPVPTAADMDSATRGGAG